MDFKENIKLGGSAREVSQVFYQKSQRTVFAITVITKDKFHIFDFVSEDLIHDAQFVQKCINKLIFSPEFHNLKIKQIGFWSDGGKHFRNGENVNYYMELFEQKQFELISFNFFIEYHGKSYCDSHFSVISRIVSDYELNEGQIQNTDHLIQILKDKFLQNSKTKKTKLNQNITIFKIDPFERKNQIKNCKIINQQFFYNFTIMSKQKIFGTEYIMNTEGKILNTQFLNKNKNLKQKKPSVIKNSNLLKINEKFFLKEKQRNLIKQQPVPQFQKNILTEYDLLNNII
jgi:hypothetical protein